MSEEDELELEFYLNQERISAEVSGFKLDEEAFRQTWLETVRNGNRDGFVLRLQRSMRAPIAPDDLASWNPRLSEIGGAHDFTAADINALSGLGVVFVNDLISLPKAKQSEIYNSLPEPMFGRKMFLDDFRATIRELRDAYPKAHYFLAQPIRQSESPESGQRLPCRPDGGRDGSGMMV